MYDFLTDSFVGGHGGAVFPQTDDIPYWSTGEIGARRGELSYNYAIDPVGTNSRDADRPFFEEASARVLFDAVWQVNIIPEPASLPLASLVMALIAFVRAQTGRQARRNL